MNLCDVCGAVIGRGYFYNPVLLGADEVLCFDCYLLWYEEGLTNREEIRKRRFEGALAR